MNNFHTDDLLELARQRAEQELQASRLFRETRKGSPVKLIMALFRRWMVKGGENLQGFGSEAGQKKHLGFSQNKIRKARV